MQPIIIKDKVDFVECTAVNVENVLFFTPKLSQRPKIAT